MKSLFFFLFMSFTAWGGWVVNPDHSELLFKTTYLNETEVTGRFNRFTGTVEFDGERPLKLRLQIEVSSIDTGHRVRDGHLRANDFLKAQQYPLIVFNSAVIKQLQGHEYVAQGELTLRGVARPFNVSFELRPAVTDTWGHPSKFVKFTGKVNRQEFGINWNKTIENNLLMLGDEVVFWGTMQLQDKGAMTPGPKHLIPDTPYIREREKLQRGEITQAEFDRKFPSVSSRDSITVGNVNRPVVETAETAPQVIESRSGFVWWSSFVFLGLIGFFGTLAGVLFVKKALLEKYPVKYDEIGRWGYLTDLVGIAVLLLYAAAFWNVGWGQILH